MYGRRLRPLLPDGVIRCSAWLCLLLLLYPMIGAAATTTAVPVVTNIAGAVELRSPTGSSHDVFSSQVVHSGDLLMTGVSDRGLVFLAGVTSLRHLELCLTKVTKRGVAAFRRAVPACTVHSDYED